jgi:hypothetical protein
MVNAFIKLNRYALLGLDDLATDARCKQMPKRCLKF